MDLKLGDFVTIVCDIPFGCSERTKVKGNLGIITKVCDYTSCNGDPCFEVKDNKGNTFAYESQELIPAFETDIRRVLRELLERR